MNWPKVVLKPLDEQRIREAIDRRFPKPKRLADQVWQELADRWEIFGDLLPNPLFLDLVCRYRQQHNQPPETMGDAFAGFVQRRLADDAERLAGMGLDAALIERGAAEIAFRMTASPDLGLEPALDSLLDALRSAGWTLAATPERVIDVLTEVHLATVQRRDGAVRFRFAPHRRFQEFFATRAVRAPGRIDPDDLLWTDVWRDTTVTLLETGNPRDLEPIHAQIRGITALWADAHGLPEHIDGLPITHLQAADLTQNDQQQQGSGTHQAFIWPERALHLLGILNNVSVRRGTSPDPGTATNVDRLLLAAYATGKRLDQKTAVKVAHAGSRDGAVWLLNASFQSNSAMLADVALEQAKRMRNLPAELLPRIREAYVLPVITVAIAKRRLGLLSSMVGQPGGFDGGACAIVAVRDGTLQAR